MIIITTTISIILEIIIIIIIIIKHNTTTPTTNNSNSSNNNDNDNSNNSEDAGAGRKVKLWEVFDPYFRASLCLVLFGAFWRSPIRIEEPFKDVHIQLQSRFGDECQKTPRGAENEDAWGLGLTISPSTGTSQRGQISFHVAAYGHAQQKQVEGFYFQTAQPTRHGRPLLHRWTMTPRPQPPTFGIYIYIYIYMYTYTHI